MPRFAANLTMLFIEYPVLERFERARAAGFEAVEFLFPYEEDIAGIEDAVRCNGLEYVLFDLPIGDMEAGERGSTNAPRRVAEFRADVQRALELARRFDVKLLNCLVGSTLPDVPEEQQWETVVENLRYAAEQAQQYGVAILVEPLNTFDNPGFLLATTRQGLDLLERVGHPNLKLQYDVYHAQRMEGISRRRCERSSRASRIFRLLTARRAMSPAPARSTTRSSSTRWTSSATTAG
jgi:hydroxypyruvate isomerase